MVLDGMRKIIGKPKEIQPFLKSRLHYKGCLLLLLLLLLFKSYDSSMKRCHPGCEMGSDVL